MQKLMTLAAVAALFAASATLALAQTTDEIARQMADEAQADAAAAQQGASDVSGGLVALEARVALLEGEDGGTSLPPSILSEVNCGNDGETIQAALDAGATVVTVSGTCNETIKITRDGTSLVADSMGATIVAPDPAPRTVFAVIEVVGATNVVITGFEITSDADGGGVIPTRAPGSEFTTTPRSRSGTAIFMASAVPASRWQTVPSCACIHRRSTKTKEESGLGIPAPPASVA